MEPVPAISMIKRITKGMLSRRNLVSASTLIALVALNALTAIAQPQPAPVAPPRGGEANLRLPDLSRETFLGIDGHTLLLLGLVVCFLGLLFGMAIYVNLKKLPVHSSMREISELIYETCKTYLITQGKFILILWIFIGLIVAIYFGWLASTGVPGEHGFPPLKVVIIILFSLIGIAGSYGVAWFGIRVNTFANSRTAFASLAGKPYPLYAIPLRAGMSIGMMLISVELLIMLCILLFIPVRLCRTLFHRLRNRRISRRGGAQNCGRHLHEDSRHRLGLDEDRL